MAKKNEKSMELEIKNLQKHMGGLVRTILDLKIRVESMEKKDDENGKDDLESILKRQQMNTKAIAENKDAILKIDEEIHALSRPKQNKVQKDRLVSRNDDKDMNKDAPEVHTRVEEISDECRILTRKKCRYFNRGYCKFTKCRYTHPKEICKNYLETRKCEQRECPDRHPKCCKWIKSSGGCRRQNCLYLHTGHEEDGCNTSDGKQFSCVGCKTVWGDENCVVEHNIKNTQTFFCLNCEDWIKNKVNVLDAGWSLFDQFGYLRNDV